MTRDSGFIDFLEDYLDEHEGQTPLPDAVRDVIRAELPTTHQRPAWWPGWRFPEVNNTAKLGVAAAAVVAVALLSYSYFLSPNVGGPDLSDPTPTPTPATLGGGAGAPLEAGTYLLTAPTDADVALPAGATITVPAGWQGGSTGDRVVNGDGDTFATVGFWMWDADFDTVYADPCQWQDAAIDPPVGPTVDDLANALAGQAQRGDAVPVDVTIGGYSGKMIELTVPSDIDLRDCDAGEFRSWLGRYHQGPGQVDEIYILDVDGQRTVIDAAYMPGTADAVVDELHGIVNSIQLGGQ